jgi:hypothetical protein
VENIFMSPKIKYGQKILEFIDKEIAEVRGNISHAKVTLEELQDRQQVLYTERKNLLKELSDEETRCMAEEVTIPDLINEDFKKLLSSVEEGDD